MERIIRNKNIIVRVNQKELETIKKHCTNAGLSISAYLRMLGLKG